MVSSLDFRFISVTRVALHCDNILAGFDIGGVSRGPWPLLNFETLHSNSIFAIENHLSLAKWPQL